MDWASDPKINAFGAVYEGSIPGRFGNRKPPSATYAGDSPVLDYIEGMWVGGMFWDGRATGWELNDPLAEQARGPFLNPVEQALYEPFDVVTGVCISFYQMLFINRFQVKHQAVDPCAEDNVKEAYNGS